MCKLILGGARSGKSRFAESLALNYENVHYIATAIAVDEEIRQRIKVHQSQRPDHWITIEAPLQLAGALDEIDDKSHCVLIDCLTFWVNNCLFESTEKWESERQKFLRCIAGFKGQLIMVSNETGMGIAPKGALTRQFVDAIGWLHQDLAMSSETVLLMVAGIPTVLKGSLDI